MTEQIQLAANTISAAACLRGSVKPDQQDLWPLIFAIPTEQGQEQARDCLKDMLQLSDNTTLSAAAELASVGPQARAQRICEQATRQSRPTIQPTCAQLCASEQPSTRFVFGAQRYFCQRIQV